MPFNEIAMPQEIRIFLQDLLVEANAMPEAEELREMMLHDLFVRLQAKLFLVVAEHLEEDQMEIYGRLAQMDYAQANSYLEDQIPNYKFLFLKTIAEFREIFLGKEESN